MINLTNKLGTTINVPTRLSEIDVEHLTKMYRCINLPENYCIVALIQKVKLSQVSLMTAAKAQETKVYTIPIVGKLPEKHNYNGLISVSDKVIITRSAIEMATHLSMDSCLTLNNLFEFINEDMELKASCYKKTIEDDMGNSDVWIYLVESKIIPMSDIRATIPINSVNIDPYKTYHQPVPQGLS